MFSGTRGRNIGARCARMHARSRRRSKDIYERMREAARRRLGWAVPFAVLTVPPRLISVDICEGIATTDTSAAISASSARCNSRRCFNVTCFYYREKSQLYILYIWRFVAKIKDWRCQLYRRISVLLQLIQHRRMHTGEKPHLCPHCAYRSARRDNLRSHVRRVHKKENLYCDTFSPRGMLITPSLLASSRDTTDVDLIQSPASSPSSNPDATN